MEANLGKHNADSFHDDQHKMLKANYILANPPFNVSDWGGERLQDDILTPGRYVGIEHEEDDGEAFGDKMQRLTSELSQMFKESNELQEEIKKKLGAIGYVSRLPIQVPTYEELMKIGDILYSFDKKIKLNHRINDNLEQQATAI